MGSERPEWFDNELSGNLGFPSEIKRNSVKNFIVSDNVTSSIEAEGYVEEIERTITLTKSIDLEMTPYQKNFFLDVIDISRDVYNECVRLSNTGEKGLPLTSYTKLRVIVFKNLFEGQKIPFYDTFGDVVREFCSSMKSGFTQLRNSNIKHFQIKERGVRNLESIFIRKTALKNKGIYPKILGPQGKEYQDFIREIGDSLSDSRLIYDRIRKKFTLKVPIQTKVSIPKRKQRIVSLDPGAIIFQTFFSPEEFGFIGEGFSDELLKRRNKIGKLQKDLKEGKNRNGEKLRNKKKLKDKIRRMHSKTQLRVKDMHRCAAKYLTDNYTEILLPDFTTKKMTESVIPIPKEERKSFIEQNGIQALRQISKKSKLQRKHKYLLLTLSHYKFKQHLQSKCFEKGCELKIVNESYTSQCCGYCGMLSKNYSSRTKTCSECGREMHRDVNGARNILIKNSCLV